MKPNKVLIIGLGHLAAFMVKEFADDIRLWGTYRTERDETIFHRVNKVRYVVGNDIPEELVQDWSVVIWNLPPLEGYKGIIEDFKNGNIEDARKKQALSVKIIEVLIKYNGAIVSGKALMKTVGIDCGKCRLPLSNLSNNEYKNFIKDLENAGFFKIV